MNETTIATLRPEQIPNVMSIQTECGLSDWSEQGYQDDLKRPDSIMLGAIVDNDLAGFIVGRSVGSEAEVHNIGVAGAYRRKGIGSELLEAFLNRCRERGANTVWLEVRVSNQTAIEFYERHGFKRSSIRKNFYRLPDEDGLAMVRRFETSLSPNNPGTLEN